MKFNDLPPIHDINEFNDSLPHYYKCKNGEKQILYHYTSGEGLKSIIENKSLWITKSNFLNDKGEMKYTFKLMLNIIEELMSVNPTEMEWEFFKFIEKGIEEEMFSVDAYGLSLSINNDSNLLWSNYAKNDGYNIGFKYPEIHQVLEKNCNKILDTGVVVSNRIIYDENEQRQLLTKEIYNLYKVYEYCKNNDELDFFCKYCNKSRTNIFFHSVFFKAKYFEQEEEFRVVIVYNKDKREENLKHIECRFSNGIFIPYIELPIVDVDNNKIDSACLKSITIGPKNNLDIAKDGLRYFLNLHNLSKEDVEIKKSQIPYRF